MTAEQSTEYCLVAIGNPLLDISAEVTPEFLEKYGLSANNAILADETHKPLYEDLVKEFKVDYIAGGAAQNSIRGAQWMLPPHSTSYFGCVGKDKYAEQMRAAANKDGVRTLYMEDASTATGTCAVLITNQGQNRSLVANLAAANNYKPAHITSPENWSVIDKARYYYISGFFLTVSPETIMTVAKHAAEKNKMFIMNLSAPFLCQFFRAPMLEASPYWDVLFGNESEALAFAEANEIKTKDIKEIALKIAALPKVNAQRSRLVVITQGADPTIIVQDGKITEYPVIPISPKDIVDTNGAGDAFVGGFLSRFVREEPISQCVAAGNYLANLVIQRSGASYPDGQPSFC